jgi:hypothetical protein
MNLIFLRFGMTVIKGASFRSVPVKTLHVKYYFEHTAERRLFFPLIFIGKIQSLLVVVSFVIFCYGHSKGLLLGADNHLRLP